MPSSIYFGSYARFDIASKKEAALLLGADNLVGDIFSIEFIVDKGIRFAWMRNRFGTLLGFFGEETSRQLSLCEAKGWKCQALLSFFAYSEIPAPGCYWGEAAIVCYDPRKESAFKPYLEKLSKCISEGVRPDVNLIESGIARVLDSKGKWIPTTLVPLPQKSPGVVFCKTHRSLKERMIEEGRKGNKGCYVLSWIIMLSGVAIMIFGLKACGAF